MKKDKIWVVIVIIALILIGILLVVDHKQNTEGEEKLVEETTDPIATKKSNGTFEIFNTNIKSESGFTKITTTVKNVTAATTEEQKITIVLLNSKKEEIGEITALVPSMPSGELTEIETQNLTEYKDVYDFKIK